MVILKGQSLANPKIVATLEPTDTVKSVAYTHSSPIPTIQRHGQEMHSQSCYRSSSKGLQGKCDKETKELFSDDLEARGSRSSTEQRCLGDLSSTPQEP